MIEHPTPFYYRNLLGRPENYFIHDGYTPRLDNAQHDDSGLTDEFQREVYEYARRLLQRENLAGVLDVGCGSGYKLVHLFAGQGTLGLEIPAMVGFLQKTYPTHHWRAVDLTVETIIGFELLIAADVIEHLPDPDVLLAFVQRAQPKRIILSTPERDLLDHGTWDGPPRNPHHIREWNWAQFHAYIGSRFSIREHFACGPEQGTQLIDCELL